MRAVHRQVGASGCQIRQESHLGMQVPEEHLDHTLLGSRLKSWVLIMHTTDYGKRIHCPRQDGLNRNCRHVTSPTTCDKTAIPVLLLCIQ